MNLDSFAAMNFSRRRVTLNVRGVRFQTMEETLAKFPDTLLGNTAKRRLYYDSIQDEYFFDRDKFAFDSILFYYQTSGTILSRPETVPEEIFDDEVEFFQIPIPGRISHDEKPRELPNEAWRKSLWLFLEDPQSSKKAYWFAQLSMLIIFLSVTTFCVESMFNPWTNNATTANSTAAALSQGGATSQGRLEIWFILDTCFVAWFISEYLARLLSAPSKSAFVISPLAVIDFVAIPPYFFTLWTESGYSHLMSLTSLRIFRLLRVVRLFKLTRHVAVLRILGNTIQSCQNQLVALTFMVSIAVVLFSASIFLAENASNPDHFPSIPSSFYWSIITMTTVGYGDVYPITPLGKLVGATCAMFGVVVMVCLPSPVFISHFNVFYVRHKTAARSAREKPVDAETRESLPNLVRETEV